MCGQILKENNALLLITLSKGLSVCVFVFFFHYERSFHLQVSH